MKAKIIAKVEVKVRVKAGNIAKIGVGVLLPSIGAILKNLSFLVERKFWQEL